MNDRFFSYTQMVLVVLMLVLSVTWTLVHGFALHTISSGGWLVCLFFIVLCWILVRLAYKELLQTNEHIKRVKDEAYNALQKKYRDLQADYEAEVAINEVLQCALKEQETK